MNGTWRVGCGSNNTCFIIVTAVLPLQKQSKLGWDRSSLSMALYDFRNASLHKEFNLSSVVPSFSESPPSGFFEFPLKQVWVDPFCLDWQECKNDSSFIGRASLTLRATRWPCGPWPSKTPQKVTSSDKKSYRDSKFHEAINLETLLKINFNGKESNLLPIRSLHPGLCPCDPAVWIYKKFGSFHLCKPC